jgi:hypothetical protein
LSDEKKELAKQRMEQEMDTLFSKMQSDRSKNAIDSLFDIPEDDLPNIYKPGETEGGATEL